MTRTRTMIKGTFILTVTGFATRFMGFFYRMFLSHTFGEESVGLYQLVFPIYALCFSFTCAGIELALSRCTAKKLAKGNKKEAKELLSTSLILTITLSCIITFFIQHYAESISTLFLHDTRCTDLLVILSYAFPFASVHSCICGYYFGMKQTQIPAISQLLEQSARILTVYLIYLYGISHGIHFSITIAVAGLVAGEIVSSLYCLCSICNIQNAGNLFHLPFGSFLVHSTELLKLSVPLTGSRVLLNILQSIEAVSIPLFLQHYGCTVSDSLSIYGVLTGMALPCILFPSAITNSISTMLLPTVAEIQAQDSKKEMSCLIRRVGCSCVFLGSVCCIFLLILGKWIGSFLFHSTMAGDFIVTLAWMCPFLYTNSTLISIINGIGKTVLSFMINAVSLTIRIAGVILMIPLLGIRGYLWGLLVSQLFIFCACLLYLRHYLNLQNTSRIH
ncbi:MAG: oligosaccharide flippase family protein [Dorea sp.]